MRKALLLFPHGIGDAIMLTPCLRELHSTGHMTDMVVRRSVIDSHLLDGCPYVGKLIVTVADSGREAYEKIHMKAFNKIKDNYDWVGVVPHDAGRELGPRITAMAELLGLRPDSWDLELFMPEGVFAEARRFLAYIDVELGNYVFVHTHTPAHPGHSWDSAAFVEGLAPSMPVLDTRDLLRWENIHVTFALAKLARHRVLSCSVMLHACDAMGCTVDAVNYRKPGMPVVPLRRGMVLREFIGGVEKS